MASTWDPNNLIDATNSAGGLMISNQLSLSCDTWRTEMQCALTVSIHSHPQQAPMGDWSETASRLPALSIRGLARTQDRL